MTRIGLIVAPGAKRDEIAGRHGDAWKVRVTASAERGRANEALLTVLADALALPRQALAVVRGETSRRKVVEVAGVGTEEAERRLEAAARKA